MKSSEKINKNLAFSKIRFRQNVVVLSCTYGRKSKVFPEPQNVSWHHLMYRLVSTILDFFIFSESENNLN